MDPSDSKSVWWKTQCHNDSKMRRMSVALVSGTRPISRDLQALTHHLHHHRWPPTYNGSTLGRCKSDMHSVEIWLQIWSSIFSQIKDMWQETLWCWAGAATTTPLQPHDQEGKQPIYLQPLCTQTTILFFTFRIVFNTFEKNHLIIF